MDWLVWLLHLRSSSWSQACPYWGFLHICCGAAGNGSLAWSRSCSGGRLLLVGLVSLGCGARWSDWCLGSLQALPVESCSLGWLRSWVGGEELFRVEGAEASRLCALHKWIGRSVSSAWDWSGQTRRCSRFEKPRLWLGSCIIFLRCLSVTSTDSGCWKLDTRRTAQSLSLLNNTVWTIWHNLLSSNHVDRPIRRSLSVETTSDHWARFSTQIFNLIKVPLGAASAWLASPSHSARVKSWCHRLSLSETTCRLWMEWLPVLS